eukprot:scaffold9071_cov108-Skeletonema_dohrnii-CCMP3373.AAC.6
MYKSSVRSSTLSHLVGISTGLLEPVHHHFLWIPTKESVAYRRAAGHRLLSSDMTRHEKGVGKTAVLLTASRALAQCLAL